MSTSFWAINAAKNKRNEVVPGTSKWVANELYNMNSEVLTHTELFFHEMSSDVDQLNDFMKKALAGQDGKEFVGMVSEKIAAEGRKGGQAKVEGVSDEVPDQSRKDEQAKVEGISDENVSIQARKDEQTKVRGTSDVEVSGQTPEVVGVAEKQQEADSTSNFTYVSPEHQIVGAPVDGDTDKEAGIPQSSPVVAANGSTTQAPAKYTPKTPSPLKNDQTERDSASPQVNLSFIPIANTINPNKVIPPKLQSPYTEHESGGTAPADDSFQAISTAIRKSIAGKSAINNPRTSQFIHVEGTPNKVQKKSPEKATNPKSRATIGAPSSRNLNYAGGVSVPLKEEKVFSGKPMNKTPKRASVFASLPSREPITISSSSNHSTNRMSEIKSRSLKVFEKLEIASRNENVSSGNHSPMALKKQPLKRETDTFSGFNSTYIKESLKRRSSARQLITDSNRVKEESNSVMKREEGERSVPQFQKRTEKVQVGDVDKLEEPKPISQKFNADKLKSNTRIPTLSSIPSKAPVSAGSEKESKYIRNISKVEKVEMKKDDNTGGEKDIEVSPLKSPIINSIGSVLRRARNVFMSNPKSVGLQYDFEASKGTGSPNRERQNSRSPTKLAKHRLTRERTKSPIRSSLSSSKSKSPTKLISLEISEHNSGLLSKAQNTDLGLKNLTEPKIIQGKAEADLINRLMAPTSASAAKTVKTPSHKVPESRKTDYMPSSKNKFLTTTLQPGKLHVNATKGLTRANLSPLKKSIPLNDETEKDTKLPSKLEFSSIPSLKKKSLMAERSEAAAQKPKQKIMIAMNHKMDTKLQANPPTLAKNDAYKTEDTKDANKKRSSNILNDNSDGQTILKSGIRSTYGNLNTLTESSNTEETNNMELRDYAKRLKTENKTPSRQQSRSKQKLLEKKASRVSSGKKSHRGMSSKQNDIFNDPKTPASDRKIQHIEDILPDIPTDDEDNKPHKVLQSWAETPQLHKIVMQNRTIDPVEIFGEVPRLNIEEIFESQASRSRGKSSPSNFTPDEKQQKREAAEYAIKMGYKNSTL